MSGSSTPPAQPARPGRSYSAARISLAAEALAALLLAYALTRFGPFARAVRSSAVPLSGKRPNPRTSEVAAVVRAVARRLPIRLVCFQQGLAAQRMLRRRGVDARLHYGIGTNGLDDLAAHVWVEVEGTTVIGDQDETAYARVASYP